MEGFSIFEGGLSGLTQAEIDEAMAAFYNASLFFQQAAINLEGLQKAGLIAFAQIIPVLSTIVTNLYYFSLAALDMSSGLVPFANGTFHIMAGLEDAMDAMGGSLPMPLEVDDGTTTVKTNGINETLFNDAIDVVEDGLLILGDSGDYIEQALDDLKNVSLDDVAGNISLIPYIPENATNQIIETLQIVENYMGLFEGGATVIAALLDKPEVSPGVESNYATLIHFLYGAYNLFKAGDTIADITAFNGTEEYFGNSYGNFSLVQDRLNQQDILDVATSDIPFLSSTTLLILDVTDIGVPLCDLGHSLASGFISTEELLSVFDTHNYEDVTNYADIISNLDILRTTTSDLSSNAIEINDKIDDIQNKTASDAYGELNSIATTITDQLVDFDFVQYVDNAKYVVNSIYYTFVGIESLSYVMGNVTEAQTEFGIADYAGTNSSLLIAEINLANAVGNLTLAESYMDDAVTLGGMTQLNSSKDAISTILASLVTVQSSIDIIQVLMADPVTNTAAINNELATMLVALVGVNSDLQDVTSQ